MLIKGVQDGHVAFRDLETINTGVLKHTGLLGALGQGDETVLETPPVAC